MELKRNIASRVPTLGLWLIVVFAIIFEIFRHPDLVIENIPVRAVILALVLIGLTLLSYLLEKLLPKREVLFCKVIGPHLIIAPRGRKLLHWKFKIEDIDEIRVARKKYSRRELYIFLKNGLVRTFDDKGEELERLVEFLASCTSNIVVDC